MLIVSFSLLYLVAKTTTIPTCSPPQPCPAPFTLVPFLGPAILQIALLIATVFPAPLNVLSAGVGVLAASVTLVVKVLDAPLGSGQRFRSLEGKLAKRPGVRNPAALAASLGRKTHGPTKFQRLNSRARRRK